MRIDVVAVSWEAESTDYATHISELSAALSRLVHEVTLYVRRHTQGQPSGRSPRSGTSWSACRQDRRPGCRNRPCSPHLDDFADFLDRAWMAHTPDMVHLHSWTSGLAVRESEAPLVQSFHGLRVEENHFGRVVVRRRTDLEQLVALAADRVFAAATKEVFGLVRLGVPGAKVSLVPWGVDTDRFHPGSGLAPLGVAPRVLALGDIAPHSGFDTAITALAAVPDAELLITRAVRSAGNEDREVARLTEHARRLGVAHRVRFTGRVDQACLPALLRSVDVAVSVRGTNPPASPRRRPWRAVSRSS